MTDTRVIEIKSDNLAEALKHAPQEAYAIGKNGKHALFVVTDERNIKGIIGLSNNRSSIPNACKEDLDWILKDRYPDTPSPFSSTKYIASA